MADADKYKPPKPPAIHSRPGDFDYDPDRLTCICPAGKALYRNGANVTIGGRTGIKFTAPKSACSPGQLRHRCLRDAAQSSPRQVVFFNVAELDAPPTATARTKAKIDSPRGRMIYSRHLGTVEPPFGNLSYHKHIDRFTLRSRAKVDGQQQGVRKAMKSIVKATILVFAILASGCAVQQKTSEAPVFSYETEHLTGARPWTAKRFQNEQKNFQFVIIGDRTGGANVQKTFDMAIQKINLLQPEFVINVGDLIEGYSDQPKELNAEWDEIDSMLNTLDTRFFRTPGNHDIANKTAQEVWLGRYGATYYDFVYQNVLFLVLDTEDNSRPAPPPGMKEKIELYNRLQVEDPAKAQAMLAEFMSDEAVIAGLNKPVEFSEKQVNWIKKTLEEHPDVRWTFLFMHEPCWEKPSDSFKKIQALLKERRHTMFGGHLHYYDYDNIDGYEYVTMGPAGASFHLEGPGNVDHIMWVTMTDKGPQMGNIALKGLFDRKGLDPSMFGAYDRKGHQTEAPKAKKDE